MLVAQLKVNNNMAKSNRQWIKVNCSGSTFVVIIMYSMLMMAIGASMKSCDDRLQERYEQAAKARNTNAR